jgi:hypothetical protein
VVDFWNISGWEAAMVWRRRILSKKIEELHEKWDTQEEEDEGGSGETGLGFGPKPFIYKHGGELGPNSPQQYSKDLGVN